jgi:hypothetical protein
MQTSSGFPLSKICSSSSVRFFNKGNTFCYVARYAVINGASPFNLDRTIVGKIIVKRDIFPKSVLISMAYINCSNKKPDEYYEKFREFMVRFEDKRKDYPN